MDKKWDWSKIKDGFAGFEDLVVDFVNDTFKKTYGKRQKEQEMGIKMHTPLFWDTA